MKAFLGGVNVSPDAAEHARSWPSWKATATPYLRAASIGVANTAQSRKLLNRGITRLPDLELRRALTELCC